MFTMVYFLIGLCLFSYHRCLGRNFTAEYLFINLLSLSSLVAQPGNEGRAIARMMIDVLNNIGNALGMQK